MCSFLFCVYLSLHHLKYRKEVNIYLLALPSLKACTLWVFWNLGRTIFFTRFGIQTIYRKIHQKPTVFKSLKYSSISPCSVHGPLWYFRDVNILFILFLSYKLHQISIFGLFKTLIYLCFYLSKKNRVIQTDLIKPISIISPRKVLK